MSKKLVLGLVAACIVLMLFSDKMIKGECPGAGSGGGSGGGGSNPTSRPPLGIGIQPAFQNLRSPTSAIEYWEVWWTLNRAKYLDVRKPIEWVSVKEGSTMSVTKHKIYEDLFNLLTKSIESNDMNLAWNTCIALGRTGDNRAIPILKKAYQENRQVLVKDYSMLALGWLKDPSAVPVLKETLMDKKVQEVVRTHAAAALGYIADAEAAKALKEIIGDKDSMKKQADVVAAAVLSLGLCNDESVVAILGGLLNSAERIDPRIRNYAAIGLGRTGGEAAFTELKKAMGDRDKETRISVTIALGRLLKNVPAAKDELTKLLGDKDDVIRGLAAVALAQYARNKPDEVESISKLMLKAFKDAKGSDGMVILAMGLMGHESFKPEVRKILEDRKKTKLAKAAAAIACGLLKDKDSAPVMMDMLKKQSDDPILAPYLILGLGMVGDVKAIEVIQPLWEKADKNVISIAYTNMALALSLLGKKQEVLAQLIKHSDSKEGDVLRQYAYHTMGMLGDRDSGKVFMSAYESEKSDSIKAYIIRGLGFLMEKTQMPLLSELTGDNNTNVITLIIDHLLPLPAW